jgi:hypothetical protein
MKDSFFKGVFFCFGKRAIVIREYTVTKYSVKKYNTYTALRKISIYVDIKSNILKNFMVKSKSTSKQILEEAIAEATSIRNITIQNAKEAIEESLTPHLKTMLTAKLQEMDKEENENVEEAIEEGIDDIESPMHEEEVPGEEVPGEEVPGEEVSGEELEAGEDSEAGEDLEDGEELDIEEMDLADLKNLVRDLISQEITDQGVEAGEEELEGGLDTETIPTDDLSAEDEEIPGEEEISLEQALNVLSEDDYDIEETVESVKDELMETQKELEEANNAVKEISQKLQETNLLNAKLLYVSRVLKRTNLTESQKVHVVASFERAKNVREVKLIYGTIQEGIGTSNKSSRVVKEEKARRNTSFASKVIAGTRKPEAPVIVETSNAIKRMQRLAGIIKD